MNGEFVQVGSGKTKEVWRPCPANGLVHMRNRDDITAKDGERKAVIPGKGNYSTTVICNIFKMLARQELLSQYISYRGQVDACTYAAYELFMLPLEFTARRRCGAQSSYLKRNPGTAVGHEFPVPVAEVFYKDDTLHDPYVVLMEQGVGLYLPYVPTVVASFLKEIPYQDIASQLGVEGNIKEPIKLGMLLTVEIFLRLEAALKEVGYALDDFKVEFGLKKEGNEAFLMLGDCIGLDECRISKINPDDPGVVDLSKDPFRRAEEVTPELLEVMAEKYAVLAEVSSRFV